jgi:hypothetical protein
MVGHDGIAPSISVWKNGVYLSTLTPAIPHSAQCPENWNPLQEFDHSFEF